MESKTKPRLSEHPDSNVNASHTERRGILKRPRSVHEQGRPSVKTFQEQLKEIAIRASQLKTEFESVDNIKNSSFEQHLWCVLLELRSYLFLSSPNHVINLLVPQPVRTRLYQTNDLSRNLRHTRLASCVYMAIALMTVATPNATLHAVLTLLSLLPLFADVRCANSVHTKRYFDTIKFLLRALFTNDRERFWELSTKLLSSSSSYSAFLSNKSSSLTQKSTNSLESFIMQPTIANSRNDKSFVFELIPPSFSSSLSNTSVASSSLLPFSESEAVTMECNLNDINSDNENTNKSLPGKRNKMEARKMANILSCLFTCAITAESIHEQVCTLYGATWLFDELLDIVSNITTAAAATTSNSNITNTFCYWSDAQITTMTCIACSLLAIKLETDDKDGQCRLLPQNKISSESASTNVDVAINHDNVDNDAVKNESEEDKLMCACGRLLSRLRKLNLLAIHVHGPIIFYSLLSRWINDESVNNSISSTSTRSKNPVIYKWELELLQWIVKAVGDIKKSTWMYLVSDELVALALQNFVKLNQEMHFRTTRRSKESNSFRSCQKTVGNENSNVYKDATSNCKNDCEEHSIRDNAITLVMSYLSHYLYVVIHKYQLLSSRQWERITEGIIMKNTLKELLTLQDRASVEHWFVNWQRSYLHSFTHELFTFLPFEYSFSLLQRIIQENLSQEIINVCDNKEIVHLCVNALVALFCCSEHYFYTAECEQEIVQDKDTYHHKKGDENVICWESAEDNNDKLKINMWLQETSNKLLITLQQLLINHQGQHCIKYYFENHLNCEEFVLQHIAALLSCCSKRCRLYQQIIEKCFDKLDVFTVSNVITESSNDDNSNESKEKLNIVTTCTWEMFFDALSSYIKSIDVHARWMMRVLRIIRKLKNTSNQQLLALSMTMLAECYTQEIINILICSQEHTDMTVYEAVFANEENKPWGELESNDEDNKEHDTEINYNVPISCDQLTELLISAFNSLVDSINSEPEVQVKNTARSYRSIFEMIKVITLCLSCSNSQLHIVKLQKNGVSKLQAGDKNNDNMEEEENKEETSENERQNASSSMNKEKDTLWHANKCEILQLLKCCDILHKTMCHNVRDNNIDVTTSAAADDLMCTICALCVFCWQEKQFTFTTEIAENSVNTSTECNSDVDQVIILRIVQNLMSQLFTNSVGHDGSCYHYLSLLLHTIYHETNSVINVVTANAENMSRLHVNDNARSLPNTTKLVEQTVKWIKESNTYNGSNLECNINEHYNTCINKYNASEIAISITKMHFIKNLCCGHWRDGIIADTGKYVNNTDLLKITITSFANEHINRSQQFFFLDVCAQFWKNNNEYDRNNSNFMSLQSIAIELAHDTLCSMNFCVEEYVRIHPIVVTSTPAFFVALCDMSETDTSEVVTQTLDLLLMPTICHKCNMSELQVGDTDNYENGNVDEESNEENVHGLSIIESFMHTSNISSVAFAPALASILFYSHYKRLIKLNNNNASKGTSESVVSTKTYVETVIKMMEEMMSRVIGCDSVNTIPELVHKHLAAIVLCLLSLYTDMESKEINALNTNTNTMLKNSNSSITYSNDNSNTNKADINKSFGKDVQSVTDCSKSKTMKAANVIVIVDVDVDADVDDDQISTNKGVVNESRSVTETPKHKRENTTKGKGRMSAKRGRKKSLKSDINNDDDDDNDDTNNAEHLEVNKSNASNNITKKENLHCKALFSAICDVASLQESQPTRSAIARALRVPMEENLAAHVVVKALFDILDRLNTLMNVKYLQNINDNTNNEHSDQKWTKYKSLCTYRVQRGLSGLVQLVSFLRERAILMAAKLPAMLEYCCVSPETTLSVCKVWEALINNSTDVYLREHAPTIVIDLVSLEMRCCQNNNNTTKDTISENRSNQVVFCEKSHPANLHYATECSWNKKQYLNNELKGESNLDRWEEQVLLLLHRTLTYLYWKTHDLSFWAPYLVVLSQSSELMRKLWRVTSSTTSSTSAMQESALLDTVNYIVSAKGCDSSSNDNNMQQKKTRIGVEGDLSTNTDENDDNHHVASMIAGFMAVMHSCSSKCKSVFVRCFYSYLHSASVERRLELTHSASITPELIITLLACARELKCNEDVELALKCVGMLAAIAPRLSLSPSAQAVYGCDNETVNHNNNNKNNVANKMMATNAVDPTPLSLAVLMSDSISYGNRTNSTDSNNTFESHMSENMFVNLELVLDWRKLAYTLLEVYCPRALSNTADPIMHDRAAYAIQELLRVFTNAERQSCDGIPLRTRQSVSSDELQRYVWWRELHVSVQQLLSGFTTTTYATWVAQQTERKTPEYETGMPFSQWVFALFRNLGSRCQLVIGDCVLALRNVAKRDHVLTNFLLPYMLLHVIVSGSAEDKADVITEITTIFTAAASSHAERMSKSSSSNTSNTEMHEENFKSDEESTCNWVEQGRRSTKTKSAQSTLSHTHSINEHVQLLLHLLENIEHFRWDLLRVLRTGKEPHSTTITKSNSGSSSHPASDEFKCAELLECCNNFMEHVDWSLRVRAAMSIGSNMRALRIIETQRRLLNVHVVMSAIPLQNLFAALDDRDSAKCIHRLSSSMTAIDAARSLENTGDWELALQQCELVLEQHPHRVEHQLIALRCLQKLGQLHLMSRYATAILPRQTPIKARLSYEDDNNNKKESERAYEQVRSYANEAAWRLGQWDEVFVENSNSPFNLAGPLTTFIRALHGEQSMISVLEMTRVERAKVMPCLRTTCREGYAQAYPFIAMLHALADLDDVAELLSRYEDHQQQQQRKGGELERIMESAQCSLKRRTDNTEQWKEHSIVVPENVVRQLTKSLEQRLQYTEDTLDAREPLLSLHRVIYTALGAHHEASETRLQHAQVLRNSGLMHAALNTIQQMSEEERINHPTYFTMVAELLHDMYSPMEAIEFAQRQCCNEALPRTTRAMLQLHVTNWTQAIGSQTPKEVIACYEEVLTLHHASEEAHHCLGMFYDKLYHIHLESAEVNRQAVSAGDRVAMEKSNAEIVEKIRIFAVNAATHFGKALLIGTQTLSTSLPRLLTLWLDSTSRLVNLQVESNTSNVYVDRVIKLMNGIIENFTLNNKSNCIPVYVLITALPQLLSRLCHPCADVVTLLTRIVVHLMNHFPQPCLWSVMPIAFSKQGERVQIATQRLITPFAEFSKANMSNFENAYKLFECLIKLCNCSDKSLGNGSKLLEQPFMQRFADKLEAAHFIVPTLANLTPNIHVMSVRTESIDDSTNEMERALNDNSINSSSNCNKASKGIERIVDSAMHKVFPGTPMFARFEDKVEVMNSLQRPKRIWVQTNEGTTVSFLCKSKDEPRKDIRMMEVAGLLNTLFRSDPVARRKRFALRRYAIAALNDDCAMIEWVNDISTLRSVVMQTYALDSTGVRLSRVKEWYSKVTNKLMTKMELFTKHILPASPPVLHQWFALHFSNHQSWYVARTLFTQSMALWSISGHLLGLGDRHSDNLMLDLKCGELMHVDFACLFDKGETLEVPERVRFRLTQNLTDAMGVLKADGPFRNNCETALRCNMKNKNAVMSVVETLLHDPLVEWIGRSNQGRGVNVNTSATTTTNNINNNNNKNNDTAAADMSSRRRVINPKSLINRVARRLDGFLDLYTVPPEPDSLALNVEGQVTKLINHSSSLENLS